MVITDPEVLKRANLQYLAGERWLYDLRQQGFTNEEALKLSFLTWLHVSGRLKP